MRDLSMIRQRLGAVRNSVRRLPTYARQIPSYRSDLASALADRASGRERGTAPSNPITVENARPGTRRSRWDIRGAGDPSVQGFATDMSVAPGGTIDFKIDSGGQAYHIEIFRLGYYRGRGARRVAAIPASAIDTKPQPPGLTDPSVGLLDCGNWAVSASWRVPEDAVSGVYFARLSRPGRRGGSHIVFVVRDDTRAADILFQTSDTTWQAYNRYGGSSLYTGPDALWDFPARARKISYNRPFVTRGDDVGRSFVFSSEYAAIRFLERNGYDVAYASGIDTDRRGPQALQRHRVFLSIGHDEYWSAGARAAVEAARDAGVHLMFLSGNEIYWRIRWEPATDGSGTPFRTLVCYKDTWDYGQHGGVLDPSGEPTGSWRDPRLSNATAIPNVPENALSGTLTMANDADLPVCVSVEQGAFRLWRGTGLAQMRGGLTRLAPHTVGYESDEDADNGFRPAGLIRLSTTVGPSPEHAAHFGAGSFTSTTTHHVTLYRAASGSLVFSAGSIQWAWGLDRHHDGVWSPADRRIQQATVNMLADMHVQPARLMRVLVPAQPSADTQPPASTITSPQPDQKILNGTVVTVRGTAVDAGGGRVAGVEVSIDSGATWHPADGTSTWSYTGVIHGDGPVTILSRATDDSANTQAPGDGVDVVVVGAGSLFGQATPPIEDSGDARPAELGVRFRSRAGGHVTGLRFYKCAANTGVHTGTLWSEDGQALASGTFAGESASGWQALEFDQSVRIEPDRTYVASYFAPVGHYSVADDFFYYRDHVAGPLVAGATIPGVTVNGVRADGHAFPDQASSDGDPQAGKVLPGHVLPQPPVGGRNYFVDVLFSSDGPAGVAGAS